MLKINGVLKSNGSFSYLQITCSLFILLMEEVSGLWRDSLALLSYALLTL